VLRAVATDGHRLALAERSIDGDFQMTKGAILPRKGLAEMKKLLTEGGEGETKLGFVVRSASAAPAP
jgi:DNA polymerase-3 subunit beta